MAGIENTEARTQYIDALLATTLDKYYRSGKMHDAIFNSNQTFAALKERGRIEYADGGNQINVNLMYGHNTTVGPYSRYEVLDVSPQDGMTQAIYPWAQYSGAVSIDGLSEFQNAGAGRIIKLLGEKVQQTTMTFSEVLNGDLHDWYNPYTNGAAGTTGNSATANGGKSIISIPMYVNNETTLNPGGIATATYSWWVPQSKDGSASENWKTLLRNIDTIYLDCSKGTGGAPDLLIADPTTFVNIEAALNESQRYVDTRSASWGFPMINHKGARIFWDAMVADMENHVNYASLSDGTIYLLNTKFMKLMMGRGKDFRPTGFQRPVDQDARTALYLAYLQLVCSNRRKQGVYHNIKLAITS